MIELSFIKLSFASQLPKPSSMVQNLPYQIQPPRCAFRVRWFRCDFIGATTPNKRCTLKLLINVISCWPNLCVQCSSFMHGIWRCNMDKMLYVLQYPWNTMQFLKKQFHLLELWYLCYTWEYFSFKIIYPFILKLLFVLFYT